MIGRMKDPAFAALKYLLPCGQQSSFFASQQREHTVVFWDGKEESRLVPGRPPHCPLSSWVQPAGFLQAQRSPVQTGRTQGFPRSLRSPGAGGVGPSFSHAERCSGESLLRDTFDSALSVFPCPTVKSGPVWGRESI